MGADHERQLAAAFDGQAPRFEKAPVQTDPAILAWLVAEARLSSPAHLLDAGCGPGLVAEAFLNAGHRVHGIDLSAEMIDRARRRCATHGDRASFEQRSVFDADLHRTFDAVVSRLVLHHMPDALAFVRRQVELLKGHGGVLVLCDHTTHPDPSLAAWHEELEIDRDRTHTRNLSPGELVDTFARNGLTDLRLSERLFTLDFDEWFDRGTPRASKEEVRRKLLAGPACRGFRPELLSDGKIRIHGWLATVRGILP